MKSSIVNYKSRVGTTPNQSLAIVFKQIRQNCIIQKLYKLIIHYFYYATYNNNSFFFFFVNIKLI